MAYNYSKFLFIIICFCVTVFIKNFINKKDILLLRMGMFFTVLADFCLIIINEYVVGVMLFCIVQQIYNIRYTNFKRAEILLLILISLFTALNFLKFNILLLSAILYSVCIFFSVTGAIRAFKSNRYPMINGGLVTAGMVLFLLCDINVALLNLDLNIDKGILNFLIWLFYIPSQICLAISGKKLHNKK